MLVSMQKIWNPHMLLIGMLHGAAVLENRLEAPQNAKCRLAIGPSNSTPRHLPKGNENVQTHEILPRNVHSSMIHKRKKAHQLTNR